MTKKQEIINYIKDKVKTGKWKGGDKILGENDLAEELKVSRNTVRLALIDLVNEGLIEKIHPKGTFVKNQDKKRYILIIADEVSVEGDIKKIYRFFFKIINKYIIDKGYKPIYFIANGLVSLENFISEIENEIGGVISFCSKYEDTRYIVSKKIPCVDCLRYLPTTIPNVTFDYINFYEEFSRIIEEKKTNNILIFSLKKKKDTVINIFKAYPISFEEDIFAKYNLNIIDYFDEKDNGYKQIEDVLKKIKKKPDMVAFLDDNLFEIASDYFEEYPNIFDNTPMLTHSNINWHYNGKYDITRLEFDLYEVARETVNTLNNLIEGKVMLETNKFIKPKLIKDEQK